MIIRMKHNPTNLALELSTWKELHKMVTSHTDQYTKRLSCINLLDHTHQSSPSHVWRWCYQHGKRYAKWLHHTPINTRKDYHASNFMIIRRKHNPTNLALELSTWKELHKMVTSHTDQYTKRLSSINLLDFLVMRIKLNPAMFGVGVINMERDTRNGYITHRSVHEKIIMHQPSWSYASGITQPSWRWSYQHGKSYTRWLHHTPINTRKYYHASPFMIIRIKNNPTIVALFQLHLSSRAQWSLVKMKTALRFMINIRRCDQTSRWSLIITPDIVPALGSLPTFRSISN